MELRTAFMRKTWPEGDTTSHKWVELKKDHWVEVKEFPESEEQHEEWAKTYKENDEGHIGTATRWLKISATELSIKTWKELQEALK